MRIPIAATGAVLLACGAAALAAGLGAFGAAAADGPLLDPALARFAGGHGWFLPVAAGVAEVLALAGQLWLVVQVRRVVHRWWPDVDPETRIRARAAADDLNRDARAMPGVRDCGVRLSGTADRPRLLLRLACAGDTLISEVYGELGAGPVERYREAVGMPDLPVVIRFRPDLPRPPRRHRAQPEPA
ncbi:hypothetical protein [Actinomadura livida]|uniref:Alkaline shock response membrane anchor protein AmaP n=1 Tax=Actinomadura livida TaxID=79909 RepID=A0A7W7IIE2_9ACTN|nr:MULTISPECIES: hypothetical protein [Actinomadura]MBB4777570.1 hypothetical protein [Actinomadura catellatispora]GGU00220.1 hypothetical protein GCM10010208_25060 [Actinomadura livida]